MENKILDMLIEMNQKLDEFKEEVKQENAKLRQEMNDLAKEILDKQFVFEDEYGKKIDAIFEFVDFHQKNNLKRFDRISDLENRVGIEEKTSLNHEKRILVLERKKL